MAWPRGAGSLLALAVGLGGLAVPAQASGVSATFARVAETVAAMEHCQGVAQIDFANAQVTQNNLGGHGPDTGEPVIRYHSAGRTAAGTPLDIVVSNRSAYQVDRNGAQQGLAPGGRMGEVNVAAGSRAYLRFSFVHSSSGQDLVLNNVILTFVVLGGLRAQSLTACGNSAYYLSDRPSDEPAPGQPTVVPSKVEVLADRPSLFCTTFESVPPAEADDSAELLSGLYDARALSPAQRARSLSLQYDHGVSFVDLTLAVGGHPATGSEPHEALGPSSFLFAGATPIDGCAPVGTSTRTTTTTNTLSSTVTSTRTTTRTSTVTTTTSTVTTATTTSTTRTTTTLEPLLLWNCFHGEAGAWPHDKKVWCCKRERLGCAPQIPDDEVKESHNCHADYSRWKEQWTYEKKVWCCKTHKMGCEYYNCTRAAASSSVDETVGWSSRKQEWCCTYKGVSCPPGVPESAPQSFECPEGEESTWSSAQVIWCCANHNVGCEAKPYDCSANTTWEDAWSPGQKVWCWQNEQRGFPQPFDCQAGFVTWESSWSGNKKAWCCQHEKLGCGFDCTFLKPATWLPVKRRWCCQMRAVGCADMLDSMTADFQKHGLLHTASANVLVLAAIALAAAGALVAGALLVVRRSHEARQRRSTYHQVVQPLVAELQRTGPAMLAQSARPLVIT